jgi:hypothetical protein
MIIKVPIYVEIEKIDNPSMLPNYVATVSDVFVITLRKENYQHRLQIRKLHERVTGVIGNFKIINKEKAIEILRTTK